MLVVVCSSWPVSLTCEQGRIRDVELGNGLNTAQPLTGDFNKQVEQLLLIWDFKLITKSNSLIFIGTR
jgi:hypothetical protein